LPGETLIEPRGSEIMTDRTKAIRTEAAGGGPSDGRARGDVAAKRACMRCAAVFQSEGFGQRICPRCKGTQSWRSAVADGSGHTRRRTAARSS